MEIHPIRNDRDHAEALKLIERYWDAADGSPEADRLDVLSVLVDAYEDKRWPIKPLDPIETILEHMEATDRKLVDLGRVIGSRSRATEVMNRTRPLTLNMVRGLVREWHLPAEVLIVPYGLKKPAKPRAAAFKKQLSQRHNQKTRRVRVAALRKGEPLRKQRPTRGRR